MKRAFQFIAASLLLLAGCTQRVPEPGAWSGTIALADSIQLPFSMYLDLRASSPEGWFLVGDQRHSIPELEYRGDSLVFKFSEYGSVMRAVIEGNAIKGTYFRVRAKGTQELAFRAERTAAAAAKPDAGESQRGVRLAGKFQIYALDQDAIDSSGIATFWVKGDSVYGTFMSPSGDDGLLVGAQKGNRVQLGRFTGWQATFREFRLIGSNWSGQMWNFKSAPVKFTLLPRPANTALPPTKTKAKDPKAGFAFSGVTADGKQLANTDPRFKGKAVIVDIMGTWCHNCGDAAPVLQQLYSEFHDQGLEIVSLAFEMSPDQAVASRNLSLFTKRHQLAFPVLFAGSNDPVTTGAIIHAQLENFEGYPTAVFVDRSGTVRAIHSGFNGPGTGEEYQRETARLRELVRMIMK